MQPRTIYLQPAAPRKPAPGVACNGCGVCCAAEPCPLGALLSRRRRGACAVLSWDAPSARYQCGALRHAPRMLKPLVRRWIGAGVGCDSDLLVQVADLR